MARARSTPKKKKARKSKKPRAVKELGARRLQEAPGYIEALGKDFAIQTIPLDRIDLEDTTFRFRVALRLADLIQSIRTHGQQVPLLLREVKGKKLQIISGFRRIEAIRRIGWDRLVAVVLGNLSDEQAFKVSVLENESRKTYSDLDRAYAIVRYRQMGLKVGDIATNIFRLSRRQVERLQSLTALPKTLQDAVANDGIKAAHAVVLKQLANRVGGLDYRAWVTRIQAEDLSVGKLRRAVLGSGKRPLKTEPIQLFVTSKDRANNTEVLRFRPVRLNPAALTDDQRKRVAEALRRALAVVERRGAG